MARDFTPTERGYLRHPDLSVGFFLDLFTDTTSIHYSNLLIPMTYDFNDGLGPIAYEPAGGRWSHGDQPISMGTSTPEPLTIDFDASR